MCNDGSYYTGYTKDIQTRFQLHIKGKAAKYTRMHKPEKIVLVEKFSSRSIAMKREKAIKAMSRIRKIDLIMKKKWQPPSDLSQ